MESRARRGTRDGSADDADGARSATAASRDGTEGRPLDAARATRLLVVLLVACLPATLDTGALGAAAQLHALAAGPEPWLVPEHAGLLYLRAPLAALSAVCLVLSPGLVVTLAMGAADRVGAWLVRSLAASIVVLGTTVAACQIALGDAPRGAAFAALVLAVAGLAAAVLYARLRAGTALPDPTADAGARATALSLLTLGASLMIALAPKIHWESFNGDGVHAFEATRLLLRQVLPFWPEGVTALDAFPGLTSMLFTFPGSWFLRLFGEIESAVRVPFLLYLVGLHGGVLAVAGSMRPLGVPERWLLSLQLAVYAVVMAFSATYSPYAADLALPATQDTLLVACFLGFVHALIRRDGLFVLVFAALAYASLPSGLLLMVFFLAAWLLLERPIPWRTTAMGGAAVLACMGVAALAPAGLDALGLPGPGHEYSSSNLRDRLATIQLEDVRRVLFAVLPGGIAPALALLVWPRQPTAARALTGVTLLYFGFFYVQASVSLHHFVPAMLLPIAVLWSCPVPARLRPAFLAGVGALGLAALLLSLPEHAVPYTAGRTIGTAIDDRFGPAAGDPSADYDGTVYNHARALNELFLPGWDPRVPGEAYGDAPIVWLHYAQRARLQGERDAINYVLAPRDAAPPKGFRLHAEGDDWALYLRDEALWQAQRALRPPTPPGSAVYFVSRDVLFGRRPFRDGPRTFDVADRLRRLVR